MRIQVGFCTAVERLVFGSSTPERSAWDLAVRKAERLEYETDAPPDVVSSAWRQAARAWTRAIRAARRAPAFVRDVTVTLVPDAARFAEVARTLGRLMK
jgi:hypothetical protein